jgi:hypothetical protein
MCCKEPVEGAVPLWRSGGHPLPVDSDPSMSRWAQSSCWFGLVRPSTSAASVWPCNPWYSAIDLSISGSAYIDLEVYFWLSIPLDQFLTAFLVGVALWIEKRTFLCACNAVRHRASSRTTLPNCFMCIVKWTDEVEDYINFDCLCHANNWVAVAC